MMYMALASLTDHLFHPFLHGTVLVLVAWWLLRRHRATWGYALLAVGLGWVLLSAMPAFAGLLWRGLAAPYPQADAASYPRAEAIVVLGGGALPLLHGDWAMNDDAHTRLAFAWRLWIEKRAPRVVTVGEDQALQMVPALIEQGVPRTIVLAEDASRNTHENGVNAAALLHAHGIRHVLLVTSDIHMARAAGTFRVAGIDATPAPAHEVRPIDNAPWQPRRDAVSMTARCLREYVALWIYRYRGWC